jgi:ubiquinone/menaquinone biosynthesis C-methylase UbiE
MEEPISEAKLELETELDWTGERYLPNVPGIIMAEHQHRYVFANNFVKGKVVLDIACGEGYGSYYISNAAQQVIGVDISKDAVTHAAQKYNRENLSYLTGDCAQIPLDDNSVDVIISFETIEHHDKHVVMMNEIHRVLKEDGLLIISSPDKHYYSDIPNYSNPYHVKELYRDELEALIQTYFSNTCILSQKLCAASLIITEDKDLKSAFKSYHNSTYEFLPDNITEIFTPLYQVAIASNAQLPDAVNTLLSIKDIDINELYSLKQQNLNLGQSIDDIERNATQQIQYRDALVEELREKNKNAETNATEQIQYRDALVEELREKNKNAETNATEQIYHRDAVIAEIQVQKADIEDNAINQISYRDQLIKDLEGRIKASEINAVEQIRYRDLLVSDLEEHITAVEKNSNEQIQYRNGLISKLESQTLNNKKIISNLNSAISGYQSRIEYLELSIFQKAKLYLKKP